MSVRVEVCSLTSEVLFSDVLEAEELVAGGEYNAANPRPDASSYLVFERVPKRKNIPKEIRSTPHAGEILETVRAFLSRHRSCLKKLPGLPGGNPGFVFLTEVSSDNVLDEGRPLAAEVQRLSEEGLVDPYSGAPAVADHSSSLPEEGGQLPAVSGAEDARPQGDIIAPEPRPDFVLTLSACVRPVPVVVVDPAIDPPDQPRQPETPPWWDPTTDEMVPAYHEMRESNSGPGALPVLCISDWGVLLDPPDVLVSGPPPGKIFPDYAPAILIEEGDLWHLLRENLERARQQAAPDPLAQRLLRRGLTAAQALARDWLSSVSYACHLECYTRRYPLEPFHHYHFSDVDDFEHFPREEFRSLSQADKRTHIEQHIERIRFMQRRLEKLYDLDSVEVDARFRQRAAKWGLNQFIHLDDEGLYNLLWERYEALVDSEDAQSEAPDAYEEDEEEIPALIPPENESGEEETGGNDGDGLGLSDEEEGHGENDSDDLVLSEEEEGEHGGNDGGDLVLSDEEEESGAAVGGVPAVGAAGAQRAAAEPREDGGSRSGSADGRVGAGGCHGVTDWTLTRSSTGYSG